MNNITGELRSDFARQFCEFKVGKDYYVVEVFKVQEIITAQELTSVPLAPEHIKGLINLRGQTVTCVDLRTLFGLCDQASVDKSHMNVIIQNEDMPVALMVDEIGDVVETSSSSFEKTPDTLDEKIKKYIKGVYKIDNRLLIELNLDEILSLS